MNKFKHLQIIGTITVLSPIILVVTATLIFWVSLIPSAEVVVEEVAEVKIPDTVVVVQEIKPVPVIAKPTPVVKPTPILVFKDTVKAVVESLDTTK
jgi:hypothetical protein